MGQQLAPKRTVVGDGAHADWTAKRRRAPKRTVAGEPPSAQLWRTVPMPARTVVGDGADAGATGGAA